MERERNGKSANDAEKDGIRKAALFLSILDAKAADALLARFEPDVARAIEAEARRIGNVAPEAVDAIVAEFLALSEPEAAPSATEKQNAQSTQSTQKARVEANGQSGRNAQGGQGGRDGRPRPTEKKASFDVRTEDGDVWRPLDAIAPERLARMLSGASRTTVAIAASRLSERRRSAVVALLPTEKADGARRVLAALERTTDAARRLEDALFNGAVDDE